MLVPTILLALSAPTQPGEPPACALEVESLRGILDRAKVSDYEGGRQDRHFVEHALVEGRRVGWRVGGCAHYSYSVTFAVAPAELADVPLRALARRLLKTLPLADERAREDIATFEEALGRGGELRIRARRGATVSLPLDCGTDNTCALEIGADALTLSFDFPL